MDHDLNLSIDELASAVGVPVRTVRFYISEGLLPGPRARGKGASYGEEHLLRLRLIRRLAERHVPLAEIRSQLERLAAAELRGLLAEEEQRSQELERRAQGPSPREYVSALLRQAREAREPGATYLSPPVPAEPAAPQAPPAPARQTREPDLLALASQAAGELELRALEAPPPDSWERWELAPGVELHVRADVKERYRELIRRLLWAARR